ncbi:hypothetical protein DF027_27675 [Burkholderia cenocepacia]|nr:hypothetical protein DF040_13810 [Burkholderia cenocepacia]RQV34565.1 hypothetical protein DF027_27675 [Burkholderia cenocepacia]RQV37715.1 hypothetical protein DF028_20560 [Burkholderia cenocepacia]RQV70256.1 hypothetical protein DF010_30450 [Burkholderia cenocepacia]
MKGVLHAAARPCRSATHTCHGGAAGRHATDEARPSAGRPPIGRRVPPLRPGINNNRTGVQHI